MGIPTKQLNYCLNILAILALAGNLLLSIHPTSASSAEIARANETQSFSKSEKALPAIDKINDTKISSIPDADKTTIPQPLASPGLMFIENVGQFDAAAHFVVHSTNGNLYLTDDALWFILARRSPTTRSKLLDIDSPGNRPATLRKINETHQTVNLKLSFPGANPKARLEPFARLDTVINSYIGDNPSQWHTNVPVWGGVRYVNLYPGVDLEITGQDGRWEWRLVSRHSLTKIHQLDIRLRLDGVDTLTVEGDRLRLTTPIGDYSLPFLPVVSPDGTPLDLSSLQPLLKGSEVVSPFAFASVPGLIPLAQTSSDLIYGSFLGGNSGDTSRDIVVHNDSTGQPYVYITGSTVSDDFPIQNPIPGGDIRNSSDAFVVKLNLNETGANQLVYATFLGGARDEGAYGIDVDSVGNAYITGYTDSFDLPTQNPYQAHLSFGGVYPWSDAFVTKLAANGGSLVYSTYLGGPETDVGQDIVVDNTGSTYVTGYTVSDGFPTQNPLSGYGTRQGNADIFVTKFSPGGNLLNYSTYLGGSAADYGYGITVDETGNAYVTGERDWSDGNAFAAKLIWNESTGSLTLGYYVAIGGSNEDKGYDIAVDNSGNTYLTGQTSSLYYNSFPQVNQLLNQGPLSMSAVFITKLAVNGNIIYSTLLSGYGGDEGRSIAVDSHHNAYVTGKAAPSFPMANARQGTNAGGYDAFIAKLVWNEATSQLSLDYSTYLGGDGEDIGYGLAIAEDAGTVDVYVTGSTVSSDFGTLWITADAYDATFNSSGAADAFVTKLALETTGVFIISGTVTELVSGDPIPNVTISIDAGQYTANTDANGDYSLEVPGSTYILTASATDYRFQRETFDPANPTGELVVNADMTENFLGFQPVPVTGFKGAGWLNFDFDFEDDHNVGWNLEYAENLRNVAVWNGINNLNGRHNVYTIFLRKKPGILMCESRYNLSP